MKHLSSAGVMFIIVHFSVVLRNYKTLRRPACKFCMQGD